MGRLGEAINILSVSPKLKSAGDLAYSKLRLSLSKVTHLLMDTSVRYRYLKFLIGGEDDIKIMIDFLERLAFYFKWSKDLMFISTGIPVFVQPEWFLYSAGGKQNYLDSVRDLYSKILLNYKLQGNDKFVGWFKFVVSLPINKMVGIH